MTIQKTAGDGIVTLVPDGNLDTVSADEFQNMLIPSFDEVAQDGGVVLDFSKLVYVSSAGLRVLFFGQKTAKEKRKYMKIINVKDGVKEVFDMTGFSDILKFT